MFPNVSKIGICVSLQPPSTCKHGCKYLFFYAMCFKVSDFSTTKWAELRLDQPGDRVCRLPGAGDHSAHAWHPRPLWEKNKPIRPRKHRASVNAWCIIGFCCCFLMFLLAPDSGRFCGFQVLHGHVMMQLYI